MGMPNNGGRQIQDEWQRLHGQWQATSSIWNDANRLRFEREFLQLYEPTVVATLNELDKLTQLFAQAEREIK